MGKKAMAKKGNQVAQSQAPEVIFDPKLKEKFGTSFNLVVESEGERYAYLNSRETFVPQFVFDKDYLESLGLWARLKAILEFHEWYDLATRKIPTFAPLTLEFLSTLKKHPVESAEVFSFRLENQYFHRMDAEQMAAFMGVRNDKNCVKIWPDDMTCEKAWFELTGKEQPFVANDLKSADLASPLINLMHKFVSFNLMGKREASRVNTKEVLLLWCVSRKNRVDSITPILTCFSEMVSRRRGHIGLGYLITNFARDMFRNCNTDSMPFITAPVPIAARTFNKFYLDKSSFKDVLQAHQAKTGLRHQLQQGESSRPKKKRKSKKPLEETATDDEIEQMFASNSGEKLGEEDVTRRNCEENADEAGTSIQEQLRVMNERTLATHELISAMSQSFNNFQLSMDSRLSNVEYVAEDYCRRHDLQWPRPPPADQ